MAPELWSEPQPDESVPTFIPSTLTSLQETLVIPVVLYNTCCLGVLQKPLVDTTLGTSGGR